MLNLELNAISLQLGEHFVFGAAVMVQLCGIITLFASRVCRHDCRVIWNCLYFATLVTIGVITIVAIRQESGHWLLSSSTLAIMIVGATIGTSSSAQVSTI